MKVRIKFWFQGAMHRKPIKGRTVDLDIDAEISDTSIEIMNAADNALGEAVIKGMLDFECDAGISNFGVQSIQFDGFKGEATNHFKL